MTTNTNMKKYTITALLLSATLLHSGCTTYNGVQPYAKYQLFPHKDVYNTHSTPVYGRVTVSDSKGNSTTYKISGYVR